jgi:hypothetical protein
LSFAGCVVTFYFHEFIFNLLIAKQYSSVSSLVPWMILSGGIFAASQTLIIGVESEFRTNELIAPKIVTAALGITLNFAGAYWNGIYGIVIAMLVFSVSNYAWISFVVQRKSRYVVN